MPRLSIIVPVYKVERYLRRCVDSLLSQTFEDFELILVDDGSPDSCPAICDDYAALDPRVRVVHKVNGGLSDARNAGIEVAQGEWLGFIDSDDWADPRMFQVLIEGALANDVDMAICGMSNVYGEGGRIVPQCEERREFVCDNVEAFGHLMVGRYIAGTVCTKLIKRSAIGDTRFLVGRFYEDAFFLNLLMPDLGRVWVTTEPLYYYLHRPASITSRSFSHKHMDMVDAYEQTMAIVKERFPQLRPQAEFRLQWAYFCMLDKMLVVHGYRELPDFEPVLSFLRGHAGEIIHSAYFALSRRIAMRALKYSVPAYRFLLLRKTARDYRQ